jgi:hypothetical protein
MVEVGVQAGVLLRLIDDASLFPPAELAMGDAVRQHRDQANGAYAEMQGRFVVTAARVGEMAAAGGAGIVASVIFPAAQRALGTAVAHGLELVRTEGAGIVVNAFEGRLPDVVSREDLADACRAIVSFARGAATLVSFEIPFAGAFVAPIDAVLAELAEARALFASDGLSVTAKLRCGGLSADAVPSVADVGNFICAAKTHRVPFKATAGLHHPIRTERAANGLPMHGFLNVLFAALAHDAGAIDGAGVERVVADTDPAAFTLDDERFAWRGIALDRGQIENGRVHAFLSYGSCSFAEPVADLQALGMLA